MWVIGFLCSPSVPLVLNDISSLRLALNRLLLAEHAQCVPVGEQSHASAVGTLRV